jgi:cytochrome c
MKHILLILSLLLLASCKKVSDENAVKEDDSLNTQEASIEFGKEIFEGRGTCVACHQIEQKIIGPGLKEIAKIYKANNADMVLFLKGEGEALVDPSQYEVMKTNFAVTKNMTDVELKSLEMYIKSHGE